jgi:hypothetical protein
MTTTTRPRGALRGLTPAMAAELARGINGEHNTNPGLQVYPEEIKASGRTA